MSSSPTFGFDSKAAPAVHQHALPSDHRADDPLVEGLAFRHTKSLHSPVPSSRWSASKLAADAASVITPVALLGFIVALCLQDGRDTNGQAWVAWTNAITVLASVFPIIFAAIIGRCTYQAARWRLEAGTTMISLEQLLGSRSVGSVITTQLGLGTANLLALVLLLAWVFSPLGSQSVLRIMGSSLDSRVSRTTATWFDNLHESGFAMMSVTSPNAFESADTYIQYLRLLFGATVMAPEVTKQDAMDQWGNVKIPYLPFRRDSTAKDTSEWLELDPSPSVERFSSLAGIPIAGIPHGNTSFSIDSTYIELDCDEVELGTSGGPEETGVELIKDITWDWPPSYNEWNESTPANGTWQGTTDDYSFGSKVYTRWQLALNRFVDRYWVNQTLQWVRLEDEYADDPRMKADSYSFTKSMIHSIERFVREEGIHAEPTELVFQAVMGSGFHGERVKVAATCGVRQRYVESRVSCESADVSSPLRRDCAVTAQRPSQEPRPTELISHLNIPHVWEWVAQQLTRVVAGGGSNRPDLVIQYLNDPSLASLDSLYSKPEDMFRDIDPGVFSRRLGQALNTFMLLSQVHVAATGASQGVSFMEHNITTWVDTTILVETYAISRLWVAIGFVSCGVLLVGGVLSVVLRHKASGPEVLGFASTVIRDSRYIDLVPQTGRMDGLDIAKMMENERVRYGHTDLVQEGQPLVGVGREEETRRLRDRR